MAKVLVCKDTLNNKIIDTRVLNESDNIKYEVIDSAPLIEERENEVGQYELDENGDLVVTYSQKPKTQLDLIQEQLNQLIQNTSLISKELTNVK